MSEAMKYRKINISLLVPFKNHPFKLYEGQRFTDMVESVRASGVLAPIIVRPVSDGKFEILSGHNRVASAVEAGLQTVPSVVYEGLTDEEALFVVTETNLIQRSFADMKHGERAIAIATHYNAMKKKSGYRSDLLGEIEGLTSSPVAKRLRKSTMGKLGEQYGLSKDTIARYLRVNCLIDELKERLDSGKIALRVAVILSYLREKEQKIIVDVLAGGKTISIKQVNIVREESEKGELNKTAIKRIIDPGFFPAKVKSIKFSRQFISQFFNKNQSTEEIENVVVQALTMYFSK